MAADKAAGEDKAAAEDRAVGDTAAASEPGTGYSECWDYDRAEPAVCTEAAFARLHTAAEAAFRIERESGQGGFRFVRGEYPDCTLHADFQINPCWHCHSVQQMSDFQIY